LISPFEKQKAKIKSIKIDIKISHMLLDIMSANQGSVEKTNTQQEEIEAYISGLTEQEKIVMNIAQEHLESSFDISKSIGFLTWKQKQLEKI